MIARVLRLSVVAALAGTAWSAMAFPVTAQSAVQARPILAGENFVRAALSSSVLQAQAAELAASRETRPEVRAYAREMATFRRDHAPRIERAARDNGVAHASEMQFEHKVQMENLAPLDFLALSRRYAELQVEALEQEVQLYAEAANSPDEWVKAFTAEIRPKLGKLLDGAREMRTAVGP